MGETLYTDGHGATAATRPTGSGVPLSQIMSVVLAVCLAVLWLLFAYYGDNTLIDFESVLLLTAQLLWLLIVFAALPDRKQPVLQVFGILVFLYFPLRTMALIADPTGLFDQFVGRATSVDMNNALRYVLLAMVCSTAGIVAGVRLGSKRRPARPPAAASPARRAEKFTAAAATVVLGAVEVNDVHAYLRLGLGRHSADVQTLPTAAKVLLTLLDVDTALIILFVLLLSQWPRLDRRVRVLGAAAVLGYALTRVIISSKGGVYYAALYFVFVVLALYNQFTVSRKMLAFALPILVLALVSYNAGRQIRQDWISTINKQLTLAYTYTRLSELPAAGYLNVMRPLSRLSGIDPMVNVVNHRGTDPGAYVTLAAELNSLAMHLIPASSKPPFMAQEYAVIYGAAPQEYYTELGVYTTYMWTMWGEFYVLFGAVGGLLAGAGVMALLAAAYARTAATQGLSGVFLRFLCLYVLYWTVLSFGLDFLGWQLIELVASGVFLLLVVRVLSSVGRIRIARTPAAQPAASGG